jgi:hypothetical protein
VLHLEFVDVEPEDLMTDLGHGGGVGGTEVTGR